MRRGRRDSPPAGRGAATARRGQEHESHGPRSGCAGDRPCGSGRRLVRRRAGCAGAGYRQVGARDWQIRCDTPPGAQGEQCALIQSVTAEDRPNVGLTVIVLKTADQKGRLMRVLAPLGVLLPSGLGLKIDKADVGRAGFVRCLPNGCVAEVVMDDNLVKQLRTGTTATYIIFQTPEEGIGIPMGLKGFGEGYDKLP